MYSVIHDALYRPLSYARTCGCRKTGELHPFSGKLTGSWDLMMCAPGGGSFVLLPAALPRNQKDLWRSLLLHLINNNLFAKRAKTALCEGYTLDPSDGTGIPVQTRPPTWQTSQLAYPTHRLALACLFGPVSATSVSYLKSELGPVQFDHLFLENDMLLA